MCKVKKKKYQVHEPILVQDGFVHEVMCIKQEYRLYDKNNCGAIVKQNTIHKTTVWCDNYCTNIKLGRKWIKVEWIKTDNIAVQNVIRILLAHQNNC